MINILRMISKEKSLIEQELTTKDERLNYYQDFFKKNPCTTLKDALSVNYSELAIAIIIHYAPKLSVEKVKELVYGNQDIFEELDKQAIEEMTILIDQLDKNRTVYEKAKKLILTNNSLQASNIFTKEGQLATMLKRLVETMNSTPKSFCLFIDTFLDESIAVIHSLATVTTFREVKEQESFRYQLITDISELDCTKIKEKNKTKMVSAMTKDIYNIKNLLEPLTEARNEYQQLEQERRNRVKTLNRNKTIYERLESDLYSALKGGEVRNVESLIKKIPSDEIRLAILKLVYIHNQEIYAKLSEEYKSLAANDSSQYQVLLAKYGISPEAYEVGTVMGNNINDLKKMLELLSNFQITAPREILAITKNSSLETIETLHNLTEKGIITTTLLRNHKSIFNPSSKEYEDFMRNLALVNKKKINPHYFTRTEEVFVTPHQSLATSLKTLEDYDLISNIKTGMNLSFLTEQDLPEAIDTLLELGYEKNLEECLELLNYKDKFERLKLLKELNIPISNTTALIEVLTTDKFYVSDSEIPNYIYNAALYHMPKNIVEGEEPKKKVSDATKLSAFSNTERTYSFNGVLISKNKVHRNLSHVLATGNPTERLIYGVMKGSTLTDTEVLKVVASLAPQKTDKAVKEKK